MSNNSTEPKGPVKNHSENKIDNLSTFDQVVYVEIRLRNKQGGVIKKTLRGEEARKWHKNVQQVCQVAKTDSLNPDWLKLGWEIEKVYGS